MEEILKENNRRLQLFNEEYNQFSGVGAVGDRFMLKFSHNKKVVCWNIPIEMKTQPFIKLIIKHKSTNKISSLSGVNIEDIFDTLVDMRFGYDFEFWAICKANIQDKNTKKSIPFQLRNAQRKLLNMLENERKKGKTVWIKLLKARQWGGSTLIQLWFAWIQCVLEKNWHSVIVADVEDQTKNIRSMYSRFAKEYNITLSPFEGSTKNKIVRDRGCVISIGSMQKPDSLRSFDNSLVHCSEVGLWKKTEGKTPEDLIQNLIASVPDAPNCAFILESTAKGVGNYWHTTWTSNHAFTPVFVAWYEIEIYKAKITIPLNKFIESLNEYELFLWEIGATLEGINWYRNQLKLYAFDHWRMQSEYPSTETEAFQSTGRRFYPPIYIENARKYCSKQLFIGDIYGSQIKGEQALNRIEFNENNTGQLWIWSKPDEQNIRYRYIVSVDIGGISTHADFSSINVFDRIDIMRGGGIERVATWHGHLDQDLLAWKAAQIASWYNNALLIIEVNSLDSEEEVGTEGVHHITILNEIADYYDNIYTRNDPEKIKNQEQPKYGFHMNRATKPAVMAAKKAAMRDGLFIEHDERAINEADTIEIDNRGKIGAVVGCHDDIEVPTATAIYVSNEMESPQIVKNINSYNRRSGGVANF